MNMLNDYLVKSLSKFVYGSISKQYLAEHEFTIHHSAYRYIGAKMRISRVLGF
uniref:Uncharacterized protein MANES_01G038000 n=1 Tax=Rhizophora mucronata TaxID=61149 RepID=A0A2P2QFP5_RHIMU